MQVNLLILQQDVARCNLCPINNHEEKLGPVLSKLNESQVKAIVACVSRSECKHKVSVEVIRGPPATGKTATLSTLLYILLQMEVRTVVCAPTNIALQQLASQVVGIVRSEKSIPLGEMLMFGDEHGLEVSSETREIFLDYRDRRLVDCLLSHTGWKWHVKSMLSFLGKYVPHQIFVDNEVTRSAESLPDETEHSESKSHPEFTRDQFADLAAPLMNCMLTFITHLPRSFIHEPMIQNIKQFMSLLSSIEPLLEDNSLTDEKLLQGLRQCVFTLITLRDSLNELQLPRGSIKEFCIENATLVFCTSISAYRLQKIDTKPFHLVVFDEATQVMSAKG